MKLLNPLGKKDREYDKILAFDIETYGPLNEFSLAIFYNDNISVCCSSKQEVINFLNDQKYMNYYIYATNLQFDFLGCLYEQSDKWKICERAGTIYGFKWFQKKDEDGNLSQPVHFRDTMRIVPFSVEKLGNLLGVPKMEHPKCFGRKPETPQEWAELKKYCENDAKISYLFVKKIMLPFLKKYNLSLKMTIGSLALEDFRVNYLNDNIFQETEDKREMAFNSYYGGRTETFQRGMFKNVYCFDINSLYPSVMLEEMPDPNRSYYVDNPTLKQIFRYEGVSEVLVEVPDTLKIPPLPYKKDGLLIFPTGTFRGYYNHNELRNAIKHGVRILEITKQLIFTRKKAYFKSFIEHHYKERLVLKTNNDPLEVMEKNIMNNLYGKFAFNYHNTSSLIPAHEFDIQKHIKGSELCIPMEGNKFFSVTSSNTEAPLYSFPIWSSYITSYARIKMYDFLSNLAIQDKIISTDTDSIFIKDYANEISTSNELGDMKLEEGYPVPVGFFVRPKMYMTHKPKCKGVRMTKPEQFMKILKGEPILQDRFVKFRTALRSKEGDKWGVLVPNQIIQIEKKLNLEDKKRNWLCPFNPYDEEYSVPLQLNWVQEAMEEETKQTNANAVYFDHTHETGFIQEILKGPQDIVDFAAKGKDISKEEYLENEISIELLD